MRELGMDTTAEQAALLPTLPGLTATRPGQPPFVWRERRTSGRSSPWWSSCSATFGSGRGRRAARSRNQGASTSRARALATRAACN